MKNSYLILRNLIAVKKEILAANLDAAAAGDPCAMAPAEIEELKDEISYLEQRIGGE